VYGVSGLVMTRLSRSPRWGWSLPSC